MPKKSRVPPPPRPVQTPRRRQEKRDWRRYERQLLIAAAALVGAGVIVALVVVLGGNGGGGGQGPAEELAAAGCRFDTPPDQGQRHISSATEQPKYKSFPPTSGPHHPQPAIWGSYRSPIDQRQGVHNLEHGGAIIQYGSRVPAATVEQLNAFHSDDPRGLLMAPLPALGDKIALTAWGHLATCRRFDRKAFDAFLDAYRGKGPERIPLDALRPGT